LALWGGKSGGGKYQTFALFRCAAAASFFLFERIEVIPTKRSAGGISLLLKKN